MPDPRWELYAGDALPGDSILLDNEGYLITAVNRNHNRIANVSLTLKNLSMTARERAQGMGVNTRAFREKEILVRTEPLDFI